MSHVIFLFIAAMVLVSWQWMALAWDIHGGRYG